jgi:cilia- and flagella-associated protein 44
MGIDEFYPADHIEKVLKDGTISRRNSKFFGVMGHMSYKRFNLHFLEDQVIIFTSGNKYQIYNIVTGEYRTFHGHDDDGVGSIGVHPTRKYFAVAEKGPQPIIYIYEYPSLKLYRILKGGTEMMYVHTEFSSSGDKLVSLGGEPDFTITVWDWLAQRVILKSKAFSAEVFRASFSPFTDDIIFTSGSTHIKFWKMAHTFTGLKLQGEIGKFGKLELSDVSTFYELPDGKVLSGTDQGTMILWDGVQVKAHLVLDVETKRPLHKGAIEVILFENDEFISCGTDGYIKWWSLVEIDNAEADEVAEVAIRPIKEICIKTEKDEYAIIMNMVKGTDFWLVQDARGHLWSVNCGDFEAKILMDFHSGAINDLAISDSINMAVSVSQDGNIKLWDYVR